MHVALPKHPINQFKPVQQSRQQAIRAYCPNVYTDVPFLFFSRLSIVNTEDGHSIFTLNPAAPSDAGLYKVVARNPLGQVTATIRVVLGDICGSPDSPSVEAMTDTDILLSWKTPSQLNHAPVIAYKVQMGYIGEFALVHIFM